MSASVLALYIINNTMPEYIKVSVNKKKYLNCFINNSSINTGGWGRIRTFEVERQRIYSPAPLATREPIHISAKRDSNSRPSPWQGDALPLSHSRITNAQTRNRTKDTRIFSPLLYQLSYLGIWNSSCCKLLDYNNKYIELCQQNF